MRTFFLTSGVARLPGQVYCALPELSGYPHVKWFRHLAPKERLAARTGGRCCRIQNRVDVRKVEAILGAAYWKSTPVHVRPGRLLMFRSNGHRFVLVNIGIICHSRDSQFLLRRDSRDSWSVPGRPKIIAFNVVVSFAGIPDDLSFAD